MGPIPSDSCYSAEKSVEQARIASSFEFVQHPAQASGVRQVLKLQADIVRRKMQELCEQAREPGEIASKAARNAAAPKQRGQEIRESNRSK